MGMVGLGRMGANMVRRLMRGGHACVVHDRDLQAVDRMAVEGAEGAGSLEDLVARLDTPRVVWVMLPAGAPTEETLRALSDLAAPGDILIDGGNSYFKDDVRRSGELAPRGVRYLDVGTSGGLWGLERGYCLMVGGDAGAFRQIEPILRTLAPGQGDLPRTPGRDGRAGTASEGYLYCGPAGAGHFVKMVHNGIEYGLMQAYAEGFDIMRNAASPDLPEGQRYALEVDDIAELWRRGSVVSSWLLDLTASALAEDPLLEGFSGFVSDSGEGRWTIQAALEESVPAEVLSCALYTRFRSRKEHTFAEKVLSAMRRGFGGHTEPPTKA